jgi:hypothetical protein
MLVLYASMFGSLENEGEKLFLLVGFGFLAFSFFVIPLEPRAEFADALTKLAGDFADTANPEEEYNDYQNDYQLGWTQSERHFLLSLILLFVQGGKTL